MSIKLKTPRWVISDEGWDFGTEDRNHVEYTEGDLIFLIEVEYGLKITYIYFDTIKRSDSDQVVSILDKNKIKERVIRALDLMGGKYEFC